MSSVSCTYLCRSYRSTLIQLKSLIFAHFLDTLWLYCIVSLALSILQAGAAVSLCCIILMLQSPHAAVLSRCIHLRSDYPLRCLRVCKQCRSNANLGIEMPLK